MRGDFSRFSFDQRKHYNAVLVQQGRVTVDAGATRGVGRRAGVAVASVAKTLGTTRGSIERACPPGVCCIR